MVDVVGRIVWYRLRETASIWSHRLDQLWMDPGGGQDAGMDPLGLLLLGWIVLAGIVYFTTDHLKVWLIRYFGEEPAPAAVLPQYRHPPTVLPLPTRESPYRRTPDSSSPSASSLVSTPTESLQARVKLINYSQEGSDWVNNVLNWLYHRYNSTPEFADIWLSALNEYAKRNAQQLGILVTFDRFAPSSRAPRISDVRAELSADEQLGIFCSVETVQLGFHVLATTHSPERGVVTDAYDVDVDHPQGELAMKIFQSAHKEIMLSSEFERQTTPSIKVTLRPEAAMPEDFDPIPLQDVIRHCILNTKTTMKLARFRDFPYPYWHALANRPVTPSTPSTLTPQQTHFPFVAAPAAGTDSEPSTSRTGSPFGPGDNQVVVKVNRAHGIGGDSAGIEPYCVIEMDEPPQKHTTSIVKSRGANPVWDETFLFDVSPESNEILFELYDRTKTQKRNFLGTAIVSLHELSKNPHQRQVIPLQSRPLMNDVVAGTLTVEFSVIPASGRKSPSTNDLGQQTSPTATHVRMNMSPNRNSHVYLHETVETHASPGERERAPPVQRSVSEDISIHRVTTITNHGPLPSPGPLKRKSAADTSDSVRRRHNGSATTTTFAHTTAQLVVNKRFLAIPKSATDGMLGADSSLYASDLDAKGRSRSADRKQSLLGRIKRRFSFGKKRSKSLDPATAQEEMAAAGVTSASSLSVNGPHVDRTTDAMDRDPDVLAAERRAEKQERKQRKKGHIRSVSAPGSRDPSVNRAAAASAYIGECPTPPLGLMHDDERLHNSLVFLLSTTGNKAQQRSWKDKLRSRFSRKKSHEATIIRTEAINL
ncbi:uncharacterized protein LOC129590670 isoform X2 [Paramacrobiotus metropolitanus]|uniref:uncharacterized protein LOC129590670 isoform X2 n=1 Tax=Paramacrobiotus metropolitanus TaxID=2943436 RepID=UPI0024460673|nr:uncharacterized protein LOC129590670 isoform X2 [Paramacrobiotus metropolitanus]